MQPLRHLCDLVACHLGWYCALVSQARILPHCNPLTLRVCRARPSIQADHIHCSPRGNSCHWGLVWRKLTRANLVLDRTHTNYHNTSVDFPLQ
ncbi:hypothetical protein LY78DRAFT_306037 [Colletotrichum sublineola]|nr:hypothetical protein LY78DRAFT_306037 [Colletotrichum sublineola]